MKKEMIFYGILDFYKKKEYLKNLYDELDIEEIIIYKMYVYSLPFMKDDIKDLIWEYLNAWEESKYYLDKEWRKAKEKYDCRQRNSLY